MEPFPAPATLNALRRATSASHDAIERRLQLDGDLDTDRYGRILGGFGRFMADWEPRVRAALPEARRTWFDARSRRPFLAADLRRLALPAAEARGDAAGIPLPNAGAAFGSLYVIEGAALGGQLIARRMPEGTPVAWFRGWGDRTGGLWREFRDVLEADVTPAERDDACAAAVATFDALEATFREVLHGEAVA